MRLFGRTCRQRRSEVDGRLVDVVTDVVRGRRHRRRTGTCQRVVARTVADVAEPRRAATDEAPRPTVRLAADRHLRLGPLHPERRRQLEIRTAGHCTHTTGTRICLSSVLANILVVLRIAPFPEQPLGYNQRTTSGFISRNFFYFITTLSLQRAICFASSSRLRQCRSLDT